MSSEKAAKEIEAVEPASAIVQDVVDEEEHPEPTEEDWKTLREVADTIPASAYLVILIEFCERFTYYGLMGPFQNYIQFPDPGSCKHPAKYCCSSISGLSKLCFYRSCQPAWCYGKRPTDGHRFDYLFPVCILWQLHIPSQLITHLSFLFIRFWCYITPVRISCICLFLLD